VTLDELPGLSRFKGLTQLGLLHARRDSLGGHGRLCPWLPASLQVSALGIRDLLLQSSSRSQSAWRFLL